MTRNNMHRVILSRETNWHRLFRNTKSYFHLRDAADIGRSLFILATRDHGDIRSQDLRLVIIADLRHDTFRHSVIHQLLAGLVELFSEAFKTFELHGE